MKLDTDAKFIIAIIGLLLIFVVVFAFIKVDADRKEAKINNSTWILTCGEVVSITPHIHNKYSTLPQIVFFCDSLQRNITVEVTDETFENTRFRIGVRHCFNLHPSHFK